MVHGHEYRYLILCYVLRICLFFPYKPEGKKQFRFPRVFCLNVFFSTQLVPGWERDSMRINQLLAVGESFHQGLKCS